MNIVTEHQRQQFFGAPMKKGDRVRGTPSQLYSILLNRYTITGDTYYENS